MILNDTLTRYPNINLTYGIVKESLRILREVKSKKILGRDRIYIYSCNDFKLEKVLEYCEKLLLKSNTMDGIFSNLVGYEFSVYLIEKLKEFKVTNIEIEVPINSSKIDVVAVLKGDETFTLLLPDGKEKEIILPKGIHTFEVKAAYCLRSKKVIRQISKAISNYKNNPGFVKSHVFVLKDTVVHDDVNKKINNVGGDILRAEITKKQLLDRLNRVLNLISLVTRQHEYFKVI